MGAGKGINKSLARAKVPGFVRKPAAVIGAMQVEGVGGATAEGAGQVFTNLSEQDRKTGEMDLGKAVKDVDGGELVMEYFAEQLFGGNNRCSWCKKRCWFIQYKW